MRHINARERTICQFVNVKKPVDVSFSWVSPVIEHEFRHNIVNVVSYFDNVMTKFVINNRADA